VVSTKKQKMGEIMKNISSISIRIVIFIALLCPAVFADGDMGSGGFANSDLPPAAADTQRSIEDGDMGSGGRLATTTDDTYLDSMLSAVYAYLDSVL
jgi:hypothetical protein